MILSDKKLYIVYIVLFVFFVITIKGSNAAENKPLGVNMGLDKILSRVESRYKERCFEADFKQESTLKAMDIVDTASGHAVFNYPGKMKWVYDKPDKQVITTDGINLWIFRPDEMQVTIGKFPDFFSNGKGGSFLSNMDILRNKFVISKIKITDPGLICLKLLPIDKSNDIKRIQIYISKNNYDIIKITTFNSYDDETIIKFSNIKDRLNLKPSFFMFKIPENADIIRMDE